MDKRSSDMNVEMWFVDQAKYFTAFIAAAMTLPLQKPQKWLQKSHFIGIPNFSTLLCSFEAVLQFWKMMCDIFTLPTSTMHGSFDAPKFFLHYLFLGIFSFEILSQYNWEILVWGFSCQGWFLRGINQNKTNIILLSYLFQHIQSASTAREMRLEFLMFWCLWIFLSCQHGWDSEDGCCLTWSCQDAHAFDKVEHTLTLIDILRTYGGPKIATKTAKSINILHICWSKNYHENCHINEYITQCRFKKCHSEASQSTKIKNP